MVTNNQGDSTVKVRFSDIIWLTIIVGALLIAAMIYLASPEQREKWFGDHQTETQVE